MSERNVSPLTRRGKLLTRLVAPVATVAAIGITAGAVEHTGSEPQKADQMVTCDVATLRSDQTLWDIQQKTGISYSQLQARHPNSAYPEANPIAENQPGDIVSARLGETACKSLGGTPEPVVE